MRPTASGIRPAFSAAACWASVAAGGLVAPVSSPSEVTGGTNWLLGVGAEGRLIVSV